MQWNNCDITVEPPGAWDENMKIYEIQQFVANNIKFNDWEFYVGEKGNTIYLQIRFDAPDSFTGEAQRQHCRKWQLSEWMTNTEIVETAWAAVQRALIHEAAEQFQYKGVDIYNRHMNVEKLAELRKVKGSLQHRPPLIRK